MAIFLHTRDLRIEDNLALFEAANNHDSVLPIFLFHPEQADAKKNEYFSAYAFNFMVESLLELRSEYRSFGADLHILRGDFSVLKKYKDKKYNDLYISYDYTPFARQRVAQLSKYFEVHEVHNHLTFHPDDLMTKSGKIYEVYTPFWNTYKKLKAVITPAPQLNIDVVEGGLSDRDVDKMAISGHVVNSGRKNGLKLISHLKGMKYSQTRNIPSKPTSELSAHVKFGTVSLREIWMHSPSDDFTAQLAWHDFYTLLAEGIGEDRSFGGYNYRNIHVDWYSDDAKTMKLFEAWQEGKTGYPIIDAGMRQLKETGWQHNRLRLLCSNFLIFGLGIDWKMGEWHYARSLVDYDPCVNNGNWQWSAGVGVDRPRQWPRTYNLVKQVQDFDPQCLYMREWLPEMKKVSNHDLIMMNESDDSDDKICNYDAEKAKWIAAYKKAK